MSKNKGIERSKIFRLVFKIEGEKMPGSMLVLHTGCEMAISAGCQAIAKKWPGKKIEVRSCGTLFISDEEERDFAAFVMPYIG